MIGINGHTCIKDDGGTPNRRCDACDAEELQALRESWRAANPTSNTLAAEIVAVATRLGITHGDMPLTGPQVLQLLKDIEAVASR